MDPNFPFGPWYPAGYYSFPYPSTSSPNFAGFSGQPPVPYFTRYENDEEFGEQYNESYHVRRYRKRHRKSIGDQYNETYREGHDDHYRKYNEIYHEGHNDHYRQYNETDREGYDEDGHKYYESNRRERGRRGASQFSRPRNNRGYYYNKYNFTNFRGYKNGWNPNKKYRERFQTLSVPELLETNDPRTTDAESSKSDQAHPTKTPHEQQNTNNEPANVSSDLHPVSGKVDGQPVTINVDAEENLEVFREAEDQNQMTNQMVLLTKSDCAQIENGSASVNNFQTSGVVDKTFPAVKERNAEEGKKDSGVCNVTREGNFTAIVAASVTEARRSNSDGKMEEVTSAQKEAANVGQVPFLNPTARQESRPEMRDKLHDKGPDTMVQTKTTHLPPNCNQREKGTSNPRLVPDIIYDFDYDSSEAEMECHEPLDNLETVSGVIIDGNNDKEVVRKRKYECCIEDSDQKELFVKLPLKIQRTKLHTNIFEELAEIETIDLTNEGDEVLSNVDQFFEISKGCSLSSGVKAERRSNNINEKGSSFSTKSSSTVSVVNQFGASNAIATKLTDGDRQIGRALPFDMNKNNADALKESQCSGSVAHEQMLTGSASQSSAPDTTDNSAWKLEKSSRNFSSTDRRCVSAADDTHKTNANKLIKIDNQCSGSAGNAKKPRDGDSHNSNASLANKPVIKKPVEKDRRSDGGNDLLDSGFQSSSASHIGISSHTKKLGEVFPCNSSSHNPKNADTLKESQCSGSVAHAQKLTGSASQSSAPNTTDNSAWKLEKSSRNFSSSDRQCVRAADDTHKTNTNKLVKVDSQCSGSAGNAKKPRDGDSHNSNASLANKPVIKKPVEKDRRSDGGNDLLDNGLQSSSAPHIGISSHTKKLSDVFPCNSSSHNPKNAGKPVAADSRSSSSGNSKYSSSYSISKSMKKHNQHGSTSSGEAKKHTKADSKRNSLQKGKGDMRSVSGEHSKTIKDCSSNIKSFPKVSEKKDTTTSFTKEKGDVKVGDSSNDGKTKVSSEKVRSSSSGGAPKSLNISKERRSSTVTRETRDLKPIETSKSKTLSSARPEKTDGSNKTISNNTEKQDPSKISSRKRSSTSLDKDKAESIQNKKCNTKSLDTHPKHISSGYLKNKSELQLVKEKKTDLGETLAVVEHTHHTSMTSSNSPQKNVLRKRGKSCDEQQDKEPAPRGVRSQRSKSVDLRNIYTPFRITRSKSEIFGLVDSLPLESRKRSEPSINDCNKTKITNEKLQSTPSATNTINATSSRKPFKLVKIDIDRSHSSNRSPLYRPASYRDTDSRDPRKRSQDEPRQVMIDGRKHIRYGDYLKQAKTSEDLDVENIYTKEIRDILRNETLKSGSVVPVRKTAEMDDKNAHDSKNNKTVEVKMGQNTAKSNKSKVNSNKQGRHVDETKMGQNVHTSQSKTKQISKSGVNNVALKKQSTQSKTEHSNKSGANSRQNRNDKIKSVQMSTKSFAREFGANERLQSTEKLPENKIAPRGQNLHEQVVVQSNANEKTAAEMRKSSDQTQPAPNNGSGISGETSADTRITPVALGSAINGSATTPVALNAVPKWPTAQNNLETNGNSLKTDQNQQFSQILVEKHAKDRVNGENINHNRTSNSTEKPAGHEHKSKQAIKSGKQSTSSEKKKKGRYENDPDYHPSPVNNSNYIPCKIQRRRTSRYSKGEKEPAPKASHESGMSEVGELPCTVNPLPTSKPDSLKPAEATTSGTKTTMVEKISRTETALVNGTQSVTRPEAVTGSVETSSTTTTENLCPSSTSNTQVVHQGTVFPSYSINSNCIKQNVLKGTEKTAATYRPVAVEITVEPSHRPVVQKSAPAEEKPVESSKNQQTVQQLAPAEESPVESSRPIVENSVVQSQGIMTVIDLSMDETQSDSDKVEAINKVSGQCLGIEQVFQVNNYTIQEANTSLMPPNTSNENCTLRADMIQVSTPTGPPMSDAIRVNLDRQCNTVPSPKTVRHVSHSSVNSDILNAPGSSLLNERTSTENNVNSSVIMNLENSCKQYEDFVSIIADNIMSFKCSFSLCKALTNSVYKYTEVPDEIVRSEMELLNKYFDSRFRSMSNAIYDFTNTLTIGKMSFADFLSDLMKHLERRGTRVHFSSVVVCLYSLVKLVYCNGRPVSEFMEDFKTNVYRYYHDCNKIRNQAAPSQSGFVHRQHDAQSSQSTRLPTNQLGQQANQCATNSVPHQILSNASQAQHSQIATIRVESDRRSNHVNHAAQSSQSAHLPTNQLGQQANHCATNSVPHQMSQTQHSQIPTGRIQSDSRLREQPTNIAVPIPNHVNNSLPNSILRNTAVSQHPQTKSTGTALLSHTGQNLNNASLSQVSKYGNSTQRDHAAKNTFAAQNFQVENNGHRTQRVNNGPPNQFSTPVNTLPTQNFNNSSLDHAFKQANSAQRNHAAQSTSAAQNFQLENRNRMQSVSNGPLNQIYTSVNAAPPQNFNNAALDQISKQANSAQQNHAARNTSAAQNFQLENHGNRTQSVNNGPPNQTVNQYQVLKNVFTVRRKNTATRTRNATNSSINQTSQNASIIQHPYMESNAIGNQNITNTSFDPNQGSKNTSENQNQSGNALLRTILNAEPSPNTGCCDSHSSSTDPTKVVMTPQQLDSYFTQIRISKELYNRSNAIWSRQNQTELNNQVSHPPNMQTQALAGPSRPVHRPHTISTDQRNDIKKSINQVQYVQSLNQQASATAANSRNPIANQHAHSISNPAAYNKYLVKQKENSDEDVPHYGNLPAEDSNLMARSLGQTTSNVSSGCNKQTAAGPSHNKPAVQTVRDTYQRRYELFANTTNSTVLSPNKTNCVAAKQLKPIGYAKDNKQCFTGSEKADSQTVTENLTTACETFTVPTEESVCIDIKCSTTTSETFTVPEKSVCFDTGGMCIQTTDSMEVTDVINKGNAKSVIDQNRLECSMLELVQPTTQDNTRNNLELVPDVPVNNESQVDSEFIDLEKYYSSKEYDVWDDVECLWSEDSSIPLPMLQYIKEEHPKNQTQYLEDPIPRNVSVDSGINSPVEIEIPVALFEDRNCLCGNHAVYVCTCKSVMYCSEKCQKEDWLRHSPEHNSTT